MAERDPHGKDASEAGAKLDYGKNRLALVLGSFSRALWAVGEVGTFGAGKYSPNGWLQVENGIERYDDAKLRHAMARYMGESVAPDSGLLHAAHEAWNCLAVLELELRQAEELRAGRLMLDHPLDLVADNAP